jgi:hypothetical protein
MAETIEDVLSHIPALPENHCKGVHRDGTPDIQFKCLKSEDEEGNKVYTCTTKKLFKVTCNKVNRQCNSRSQAFVAAVTVCNQRLF